MYSLLWYTLIWCVCSEDILWIQDYLIHKEYEKYTNTCDDGTGKFPYLVAGKYMAADSLTPCIVTPQAVMILTVCNLAMLYLKFHPTPTQCRKPLWNVFFYVFALTFSTTTVIFCGVCILELLCLGWNQSYIWWYMLGCGLNWYHPSMVLKSRGTSHLFWFN